MYDDGTRAKARTIAEARGLSAAATVTGVSLATLKRWAAAEGWRTGHRRVASSTEPVAPSAGSEPADQKQDAAHSARPRLLDDPLRELATDVSLTRQAFRQQLQDLAEGHGRPAWVRDVAVAYGIVVDKVAKHGPPLGSPPESYPADAPARLARINAILDAIEQRVPADGDRPHP